MNKQILTWNPDTKMYSVRFATIEEQQRIKDAVSLKKQIKSIYDMIENGAIEEGVSVDYFIDCSAYSAYCYSCQLAEQVEQLTKGLVDLYPDKWVHQF